ncbi:unnamed protein product [Clonostachys rosea f. rosea IK726]|jgi:Icc-related predicted phosphoesterase|uniref:Calcineurin-like phosphoesterase domain-containing protein n=2 Tax=Bionectria ochroleuca TaxID=29856 RepID=A0A0B7KHA0_BIOOC|nr:unnamed protein product [Clonostachys rosea f. rosea IK726]
MDNSDIITRFLIISDTHGEGLPTNFSLDFYADVVIHCGDLTNQSKLHEFESTLKMISNIEASQKLVIPGNHDFTLDRLAYTALLQNGDLEAKLVEETYGKYGKVGDLFAAYPEIQLLTEGTDEFDLSNGARLLLYSSPYTPSEGNMGFQYSREVGHTWDIGEADVVITHGPPEGVLDRTLSRERAGCPQLFAAVARQRPKLHCFGHIHEGWGAKLVHWREKASEHPSHFTDIDNEKSTSIESLQSLAVRKFDSEDTANAKKKRLEEMMSRGFCDTSRISRDAASIQQGSETLFVNASIQSSTGGEPQMPWLIAIKLPRI